MTDDTERFLGRIDAKLENLTTRLFEHFDEEREQNTKIDAIQLCLHDLTTRLPDHHDMDHEYLRNFRANDHDIDHVYIKTLRAQSTWITKVRDVGILAVVASAAVAAASWVHGKLLG